MVPVNSKMKNGQVGLYLLDGQFKVFSHLWLTGQTSTQLKELLIIQLLQPGMTFLKLNSLDILTLSRKLLSANITVTALM